MPDQQLNNQSYEIKSHIDSNLFKKNNFDLIRLLAAAQVVLVHGIVHLDVQSLFYLLPYLNWFPGVPVFFFLSGFLISAAWERNSDLKIFFTNRIVRIFPGLWFCVLFSLITLYIFGWLNNVKIPILSTLIWALMQGTFLPQWNPDFLAWFGVGVVNGSLWTIPVELSFYIAIPFIYILASRLKIKYNVIFVILMIVSFIIFYSLIIYEPLNYPQSIAKKLIGLSAIPWIGMFLLGALCQRFIHLIHPYIANKAHLYFLLFTAVSLGGVNIESDVIFGYANEIGILNYLALCIFVLSLGYTFPYIADKLLKRNDLSYGIYIYHMIIFNSLIMLDIIGLLGIIIGLVITLFFAALSWFMIEKPFLNKRKSYLYKR